MKMAIVVADFYGDIAEGLLSSCCAECAAQNITPFLTVRVGGALEIPLALQTIARKDCPAAMVALGCVIRGETYHFEVVADNCARGILQVQLETNIPVGNGVLTVNTMQQATERLQKGAEAAQAAIQLANIIVGRSK